MAWFELLSSVDALGLRHGFYGFIFALDVSFALVELCVDDVDDCCCDHHPGKEPEVVGAVQRGVSIGVLCFCDDKVDAGNIEVTDRDAQHVYTHDEALHLLWTLCVCELEADDRDHNLGAGHDDVGEDLPEDMRHIGQVWSDFFRGPALVLHDQEHISELCRDWGVCWGVRAEISPHLCDDGL